MKTKYLVMRERSTHEVLSIAKIENNSFYLYLNDFNGKEGSFAWSYVGPVTSTLKFHKAWKPISEKEVFLLLL